MSESTLNKAPRSAAALIRTVGVLVAAAIILGISLLGAPLTQLIAWLVLTGAVMASQALRLCLRPPAARAQRRTVDVRTLRLGALTAAVGGTSLGALMILVVLGSSLNVTFKEEASRIERDIAGVGAAMELRRVLLGPMDGRQDVDPIALERGEAGASLAGGIAVSETERVLIEILNRDLELGALTWVEPTPAPDGDLARLRAAIEADSEAARMPLTKAALPLLAAGLSRTSGSQLHDPAIIAELVSGQYLADFTPDHQGRVARLALGTARCLSGLLC